MEKFHRQFNVKIISMRHVHFIIGIPTRVTPVRYSGNRIYPERNWPEQHEEDHFPGQYASEEDEQDADNEIYI